MDKNSTEFKKLKARVEESNGIAKWEGCVAWNIFDRFQIGKMEFIIIQYYGYFLDCTATQSEDEPTRCHELFACLYGIEKKAQPFKSPGEAFMWAIDKVKIPYDSRKNRANTQDDKRSEFTSSLEPKEKTA